MKKFFAAFLGSVLMVVNGGWSTAEITYSNLADQQSKTEVMSVLEEHKISGQETENLLKWITDFNEISQPYELAGEFEKIPENGMDYSALLLDDTAEAYSYLQWLNCRLTAFSLMKEQIKTSKTGTDSDVWLMFDIEAIDTIPELQLTADERSDFLTLFNQVSVSGTFSVEEHEKKIQEAWKDRKIEILSDQISLICVYLHSPEDEARFVGHTGILVETDEGLLFFEKYSSDAPFQATRLKNREELKKYLLSRSDLYGDEKELPPIITENESIL